jgi:hypothetical protein
MAKRHLQKIDLVPEWLRHTIAEAAAEEAGQVLPKETPREHSFGIVDPWAPAQKGGSPLVRRIKAEFYEDPQSGTAVVQLAWEGTTPPIQEFYKKFASAKDAQNVFASLLKELRQIESYVAVNPTKAKDKVKELFDEYKGQSDPMHTSPSEGTGTRTNTSLHLELAAGWNILNKQGQLVVSFSDEFLTNIFSNYKEATSEPIQSGELTYSTASRPHCGEDNFVASYWRKVKMADGNIVRNAALISRVGGESFFATNVPVEEFNLLCAALTPNPTQYGINYDSVTGRWYKTAAVVERYFSDPNHPEELDRILDYLGKGKGKKAEEPKKEEKKDKKDKSDDEKKLDDLLKESPSKGEEESLPLAGEGETAPVTKDEGTPEDDLMNLLQKEAKQETK